MQWNGVINKQKQPLEVFNKKRCSQKFCKIHRKTPGTRVCFNKVAGLRPVTLLKKRLWHRHFPVNFLKFLRTHFLQNTSGRLLLPFENFIKQHRAAFQRHLYNIFQKNTVCSLQYSTAQSYGAAVQFLIANDTVILFSLKFQFVVKSTKLVTNSVVNIRLANEEEPTNNYQCSRKIVF